MTESTENTISEEQIDPQEETAGQPVAGVTADTVPSAEDIVMEALAPQEDPEEVALVESEEEIVPALAAAPEPEPEITWEGGLKAVSPPSYEAEEDPADTMEDGPAVESRYGFVVLAAKRAKQLREGARPYIHSNGPNMLTTSIREVERGRVRYRLAVEEKKPADD